MSDKGRAMKRNTQGGSAFKKGKKGQESFRSLASREAADDMIDLLFKPIQKMKAEDVQALEYMMVGRIAKRLGNGRMMVYCQDGQTRQAVIRGLLRRKGQVFFDMDSIVVISLRADDAHCGADIIGLLGPRHIAQLNKLEGFDKKVFLSNGVAEDDDFFDRSDDADADADDAVDVDAI